MCKLRKRFLTICEIFCTIILKTQWSKIKEIKIKNLYKKNIENLREVKISELKELKIQDLRVLKIEIDNKEKDFWSTLYFSIF